MSSATFAWFTFSWAMVFIGSLIVDGVNDNTEVMNEIAQMQLFGTFSIPGIRLPLPYLRIDYFIAVAKIATWQSSMFSGVMQWVRWPLYLTISAGLGWGMLERIGPLLVGLAGLLLRPGVLAAAGLFSLATLVANLLD